LIPCRLIGIIEAEQTEEGETIRNDRLIAVAMKSLEHQDLRSLSDVNAHLLDEIERFFESYNAAEGREFKIVARRGPASAKRRIERRGRKDEAEESDRKSEE
jgi:inorganic pyrophosphatase